MMVARDYAFAVRQKKMIWDFENIPCSNEEDKSNKCAKQRYTIASL